ncbi:YgfZ/GcvT domain-containing protein [Kordiimonas marina]|uniref:CAF17-like 4Fe-4S cluster assembly/insertion protein YgfZ n=1 Tax=Kordiimonas marina TaxID=2872312 RepID=UPI001FF1D0DA|nr:folate-binding protein [Kordiimonas marina]MCJ9427613.1 folate-binding protein [Kordiimonas marina]
MTAHTVKLGNRSVIRLSGAETRSFLQGLVTNNVMAVAPGHAVYAALLTPQGKYLYDMIIMADGDDLLLDVEAERLGELLRRLMMYRLRAAVEITDESDRLSVWAVFGDAPGKGISTPDPRSADLGTRLVLPAGETPDAEPMPLEGYETKRLSLGVPDGSRDMKVDKYFWLETAAERLNGVSFTKGCFIGQELTARMKHRTTLKKLLVPVTVTGGAPEPDTAIVTASGKDAGEIRTGAGDHALAYLRLEYKDEPLSTDGRAVTVQDS